MFGYLKRSHPDADDADIKRAIMEAVPFQDDCSKFLQWGGDYWDCIVKAVAQSGRKHPAFSRRPTAPPRTISPILWK